MGFFRWGGGVQKDPVLYSNFSKKQTIKAKIPNFCDFS